MCKNKKVYNKNNNIKITGIVRIERNKTKYNLKLTYSLSSESAILLCLLAIREFL